MITVIYRKSDRLVVGRVYSTDPTQVNLDIQNMVNSELGGVTTDYDTVTIASIPKGHRPVVNPDLTITTEEHPDVTQKNIDKASRNTKLLALGLTQAEIDTM